jgi:hypothetical protein
VSDKPKVDQAISGNDGPAIKKYVVGILLMSIAIGLGVWAINAGGEVMVYAAPALIGFLITFIVRVVFIRLTST